MKRMWNGGKISRRLHRELASLLIAGRRPASSVGACSLSNQARDYTPDTMLQSRAWKFFTAWLKDKLAGQIRLPAEIHRDGTHYTVLVKVSGRLDTPNSSLGQVVSLFMACKGRAGAFFMDDNGVVRQCHFSADTIDSLRWRWRSGSYARI